MKCKEFGNKGFDTVNDVYSLSKNKETYFKTLNYRNLVNE